MLPEISFKGWSVLFGLEKGVGSLFFDAFQVLS